MIRHCVMLNLADGCDQAELQSIMAGLGDLVTKLDGCSHFSHGANLDFERKSQDFPYGFTMDCVSAADLQVYASHPVHQGLGGRLVALCSNGAEGIQVFDLNCEQVGAA